MFNKSLYILSLCIIVMYFDIAIANNKLNQNYNNVYTENLNNNLNRFQIVTQDFKEQTDMINNSANDLNINMTDSFIETQNRTHNILKNMYRLNAQDVDFSVLRKNYKNLSDKDDSDEEVFYINISNSSDYSNKEIYYNNYLNYLDSNTKDKVEIILLNDQLNTILNNSIFKEMMNKHNSILNINNTKNNTEILDKYKSYCMKIICYIKNNITPLVNDITTNNINIKCNAINKLEILRDKLRILQWIINDTLINIYREINNIGEKDLFNNIKQLRENLFNHAEYIKSINNLYDTNVLDILKYILIVVMDICKQNILSIKQTLINNIDNLVYCNKAKEKLNIIIKLFNISNTMQGKGFKPLNRNV